MFFFYIRVTCPWCFCQLMCFITDSQTFAQKHYTNQFQTDTSRTWFKKSVCASCWLNLGAGNIWYRSEWTLSLPAGRLLPAGCRHLGAAGPDGLQGDRGCQPPPVHWGLRHPGHGRHAVPAGLPGLLRSHQGEQMSAALCESVINDLLDLLLKHGWTMTSCVVRGEFIFFQCELQILPHSCIAAVKSIYIHLIKFSA